MTISSLQEQTFKKLREMIIKIELLPGQKISEADLSNLLEVGRTPVRESLKQLQQQNLVYTIPKSGTYVSKIDMTQAIHARFVRENIESEIMVESTARISKFDEEKLEKIMALQKQAHASNNVDKYYDLDNEFHKYFYDMVEKNQIWEWLNQFNSHLDRFRWLHLNLETFNYNIVADEHAEIFEAVLCGDTNEVKYLTIKHIHFMLTSQKYIISKFPEYFSEPSRELYS